MSSVVGRFLEHSRAFSFGVGDEEEIFISSADWMPRNFFRRVELMTPILDAKAKEKIRQEVFEPLRADNSPRPRPRRATGTTSGASPPPGEAPVDAQQTAARPARAARPAGRPGAY